MSKITPSTALSDALSEKKLLARKNNKTAANREKGISFHTVLD